MKYYQRRLAEIEADVGPRIAAPKAAIPQKAAEERRAYFREYGRLRRQTDIGRRQVAASNLRQLHSITLETYDQMYVKQGGCCAICKIPLTKSFDSREPPGRKGGRPGSAHIDHNHACCPGRKSCGSCIRGLLCGSCNSGLGCFRDNPELMRAAAIYASR